MKVLIAGQGLAGTLLGFALQERGADCYLTDDPAQTAASAVAAGIINPITGRRFVKSWRIDDLLPAARSFYRAIGDWAGGTFFHERPVVRTLFNRGEENDWLARSGEEGYTGYMAETAELGPLAEATIPAFAYAEVRRSAQVNVRELVLAARERWTAADRFRAAPFDHGRLEFTPDGCRYEGHSFDRILFCEGWRGGGNPWFGHLPFGGNKGEVLIVRIPGLQAERILKHRVFIAPLPEPETYWIGATSENRIDTDQPSATGRQYLQERLDELLTVPYEVIDHRAAVRPTVRDRRPFLGLHDRYPALGIFNGLGTKGASLGPFWAAHFADFLTGQRKELDPAVDIRRFAPAS